MRFQALPVIGAVASRLSAGWVALLLAGVVAGSPGPGAAEPTPASAVRFEHFGSREGLGAEAITALHQDRAGFIWVGTREGLFRYDGYAFRLFEHDSADPNSLSDNAIRTIYEDPQGMLWVGTNTGGLNRFDRQANRFAVFRHDSSSRSSLSHDSVYAVLRDRAGRLWVGTQSGLNRVDPDTGKAERILAVPAQRGELSHDYISCLFEDRQGRLWVGTVGGGLCQRDPESGRFSCELGIGRVFALAEDRAGTLWIGTERGLRQRAGRQQESVPWRGTGGVPEDLAGLILALSADREGRVWAGTNAGLWQIDPASGEAVLHHHEPGRGDSLGEGRVLALLADRSGALWIGTWGGGLSRLCPNAGTFQEIHLAPEAEHPCAADITSLVRDSVGGLWVGTFGCGLFHRNQDEGVLGEFQPRRGRLGDGFTRLAEGAGGILWAAAADGLYRIDTATRDVEVLRHRLGQVDGLGPGYVTALLVDRSGRLWVGTGGGGLHRLRPDGRSFDRFTHDPLRDDSLGDDYVSLLFEDHAGRLWIGTRSGGLNLFHPESSSFRRFVPDPLDSGSLGHHFVTSLFEDRRGRLWVGTGGGGLNRLDGDPSQGAVRFVRFSRRTGLIDDNVMSILPDDDGSLWIGTRRGLSRFAPDRGAWVSYSAADLPAAEFNAAAATLAPRRLLFGTSKTLVAVARGTPFPAAEASPTVLTALEVAGSPAQVDAGADPLHLDYGQVLSLEFALLDFGDRGGHRYRYRIDGGNGAWIDLGGRRVITLTDLPPGLHQLEVQGRNARGVYSPDPVRVMVKVIPPFWLTGWFRAAVGLCAALLIFAAHHYRTTLLERRNRELLTLQAEREQALAEARQKGLELAQLNERLRALAQRLEAAKEDERRRIARELHDELGQALTAAKISLQLVGRAANDEARAQRIQETAGLVDRLIGHVRTLSLDLRPPLLEELGLAAALRGHLEAVTHRAGIRTEVIEEGVLPRPLAPELEIALFRLVQEAVTNVLRHAEAGRVEVRMKGTAERITLSIGDDGRGFDVAATLGRASGASHLGLLGMIERVRTLGGALQIHSAPGRGTRLEIDVPVGG